MNTPHENELSIRFADLDSAEDGEVILTLLDAYSRDPMADGKPLDLVVREQLIDGLREHPTTIVFLAFIGETAIGIAIGFVGFSTFAAKPLINVHDLAVLPEVRGQGVGRQLLEAVEREARQRGCCKLTLEVLENNRRAMGLYESYGFRQATYAEGAGAALFYAKPLSEQS